MGAETGVFPRGCRAPYVSRRSLVRLQRAGELAQAAQVVELQVQGGARPVLGGDGVRALVHAPALLMQEGAAGGAVVHREGGDDLLQDRQGALRADRGGQLLRGALQVEEDGAAVVGAAVV